MARKPQTTAALLAFFVGLPMTGIALYKWGHLLIKPAPPGPLVVRPGEKPRWKSSVDEAAPRSSLEMIPKEDIPGGVPGAPAVPRRRHVPSAAELVAEQEAKTGGAGPARGGLLNRPGAGLAYPKLRPTRGFKSLYEGTESYPAIYQNSTSDAFYATPQDNPWQVEPKPEPPPAPPPAQAKPPESKPLAPPAPKKGYKPPQVAYDAGKGAGMTAGSGGPAGEQETPGGGLPQQGRRRGPPSRPDTFIGPPDRVPEPNPEKALKAGTCPKPGWWYNAYNGLCYFSQPGCQGADYAKAGCKKS